MIDVNHKPETGKHWCDWCETYPDRAASPDNSALTDSLLASDGASGLPLIYSNGPCMHLHGVAITDRYGLTVRAAVRRHVKRLVSDFRRLWAWSNRSIGRAS